MSDYYQLFGRSFYNGQYIGRPGYTVVFLGRPKNLATILNELKVSILTRIAWDAEFQKSVQF